MRRQPVALIEKAIDRISKRDRAAANVAAYPMGRIAGMISEQAKLSMFVPFPDELSGDKFEARMSKQTAEIFLKLAKSGQLPPRVITASSSLIDEMITLTGIKVES